MPTEKLVTRDQRRRLFTRLAKIPVKYRKTKPETTLVGDHNQEEINARSSAFMHDVVHFEQAPLGDRLEVPQMTFIGYIFQVGTQPRSIEVTDIIESVNDADQSYAWIDLANYGPEELQTLAQVLQIHPVAVQVALSAWRSPRLDVFNDHFFVTATLPALQSNPYRIQTHQVSMFIGKNYLLSAHQVALPFVERVLTRGALHSENAQVDAAFLLYLILDELLTYYEDLNIQMQEEIEQMEERALLDTSDDFLTELLHFKRYTFALCQIADQHRAIFAVFMRPDFHYIPEQEIMLYYRDLAARLARLVDTLRNAKESVNGIFDIYVSHISHHTNNVMKILTIVSTILLPTTLIFTFFSTETIQDIPILTHRVGFFLMILSVCCVSATILWRFRNKGWL